MRKSDGYYSLTEKRLMVYLHRDESSKLEKKFELPRKVLGGRTCGNSC